MADFIRCLLTGLGVVGVVVPLCFLLLAMLLFPLVAAIVYLIVSIGFVALLGWAVRELTSNG